MRVFSRYEKSSKPLFELQSMCSTFAPNNSAALDVEQNVTDGIKTYEDAVNALSVNKPKEGGQSIKI